MNDTKRQLVKHYVAIELFNAEADFKDLDKDNRPIIKVWIIYRPENIDASKMIKFVQEKCEEMGHTFVSVRGWSTEYDRYLFVMDEDENA